MTPPTLQVKAREYHINSTTGYLHLNPFAWGSREVRFHSESSNVSTEVSELIANFGIRLTIDDYSAFLRSRMDSIKWVPLDTEGISEHPFHMTWLTPQAAKVAEWSIENSAVNAFLEAHPFLVPLLAEARQQLLTYFPDASLFLEMFTDPEFDEPPKLVAAVSPADPPEAALARFREFQYAWWIPAFSRAEGRLIITVEYR